MFTLYTIHLFAYKVSQQEIYCLGFFCLRCGWVKLSALKDEAYVAFRGFHRLNAIQLYCRLSQWDTNIPFYFISKSNSLVVVLTATVRCSFFLVFCHKHLRIFS